MIRSVQVDSIYDHRIKSFGSSKVKLQLLSISAGRVAYPVTIGWMAEEAENFTG